MTTRRYKVDCKNESNTSIVATFVYGPLSLNVGEFIKLLKARFTVLNIQAFPLKIELSGLLAHELDSIEEGDDIVAICHTNTVF